MGQIAKPLDRAGFMRRNIRQVELPDGNIVCIRPLTARYLVENAQDGGRFSPEALLAESLVTEDGERLFGPDEAGETMTIDLPSFNVLVAAVMELNGLKPVDEAGDGGSAEKN